MMIFKDENQYFDKIGIYKIVNTLNQRVYIGQTSESFRRRYWHHRWLLRNNQHHNQLLQDDWNKYGEQNFEFSVLQTCDEIELDEQEQYWIRLYKNQNCCYCIQDGGTIIDLNVYVSSEARKRVGELNRQRMTGSHLSAETRRKMSDKRKGKFIHSKMNVITPETAKQIKAALVSGQSSKQVCETLNVPYKVVNNILSNNAWKTQYVSGWDEYQKNRKRQKRCSETEIQEIRRLYKLYQNYHEVARQLHITHSTVKRHVSDLPK